MQMQLQSIDAYDVGVLLGKGGFANVYRARERRTGKEVAIKVVDKQLIHEKGVSNRIVNEIKIHWQLKHAHIVELLNFFEDANSVYLVMELCTCGDLYHYIQQHGPLTEKHAKAFILQLLDGLEYLHSHRVVHRDLKLSNLLLDKQMTLKICDFGLAVQLQHPGEEHYTLCGTPNYIAPEVCKSTSHGCPADMWAVGCLFFSMCTGTPPFQGAQVSETLSNIIKGRIHTHSHLSGVAKSFINFLLKQDPSHRPTVHEIRKHKFLSSFSRPPNSRECPDPSTATKYHLKSNDSAFLNHNAQASFAISKSSFDPNSDAHANPHQNPSLSISTKSDIHTYTYPGPCPGSEDTHRHSYTHQHAHTHNPEALQTSTPSNIHTPVLTHTDTYTNTLNSLLQSTQTLFHEESWMVQSASTPNSHSAHREVNQPLKYTASHFQLPAQPTSQHTPTQGQGSNSFSEYVNRLLSTGGTQVQAKQPSIAKASPGSNSTKQGSNDFSECVSDLLSKGSAFAKTNLANEAKSHCEATTRSQVRRLRPLLTSRLAPMVYCCEKSHAVLAVDPNGGVLMCVSRQISRGTYIVGTHPAHPYTVWAVKASVMVEEEKRRVESLIKSKEGCGGVNHESCREIAPHMLQHVQLHKRAKRYRLTKGLPSFIECVYIHMAKMVDTLRARVPQVVLYLHQPPARERGHALTHKHKEGRVFCKCLLMDNTPLPDFCVRWSDGSKLRYSLGTGSWRFERPPRPALYFQADMHTQQIHAPDWVTGYLVCAQDAMKTCMAHAHEVTTPIPVVLHDTVSSQHYNEIKGRFLN